MCTNDLEIVIEGVFFIVVLFDGPFAGMLCPFGHGYFFHFYMPTDPEINFEIK
jgi:hypothetical protein